MTDTVWLSRVQSNVGIADKQGLRRKYRGLPWEEPYPRHRVPLLDESVRSIMQRYNKGLPLALNEFPEASAIYDSGCFRRTKQLFYPATGFLGARAKLADILSRFDLGPIGLIPYTIYEADEVTPHPGPFWLIGLGVRKNSFLPGDSRRYDNLGQHRKTGEFFFKIDSRVSDGDIALSAEALNGPDLWVESGFDANLWMSGRLVQALLEADLGFDWMLSECRIVGGRA